MCRRSGREGRRNSACTAPPAPPCLFVLRQRQVFQNRRQGARDDRAGRQPVATLKVAHAAGPVATPKIAHAAGLAMRLVSKGMSGRGTTGRVAVAAIGAAVHAFAHVYRCGDKLSVANFYARTGVTLLHALPLPLSSLIILFDHALRAWVLCAITITT